MASIGIHGAAATSGATDVEITAPIGQDTMANSVAVVIASDQSPVPVTIANGSDVAEGATTDAAVVTDTTGTVSGKLRGLVKWAFERMPASLGQKTMANSLPVTMASDQSATVTATGTLDANFDEVHVAVNGNQGVGARVVADATFAGTVFMTASWDGGVNYATIPFRHVASGGIYLSAVWVGGVENIGSTTTAHYSALLPAGATHVQVVVTPYTSGALAVTLNAASITEQTQPYVGSNSTPSPLQGVQLGGTSGTPGSSNFSVVQVRATNPGISASALGLVTVPWGLIDPGSSAGGYPWRLVGGRDPTNNAMHQMDIYDGAISSAVWNGLIVRPYMGSNGTQSMPTMDADARRGFMEVSRWLGSTAPTVGQKAMADSVPVVIASDQATFPVNTKNALTAAAPAAATVGTSSAQALASNANRKGLVLVNTSAVNISLGFGQTAVLNSGITLGAGASFTMDEYTFSTAAVNAIAAAVSSNLSMQEYT